jgi:hypothetical protein
MRMHPTVLATIKNIARIRECFCIALSSITMIILPKSRRSEYPKVAAKLDSFNQPQSCPSPVSRIKKVGIDIARKNRPLKDEWLSEISRTAIQMVRFS